MGEREKIGKSVCFWLGAIYALLGGIFLAVALGIKAAFASNPDSGMIAVIFGGIGGFFLLLGVIFLLVERHGRRKIQLLLERGQYVMGEITDYRVNYQVTLNHRHPFKVLARYTAPDGKTHVFRSRDVYRYLDPSIRGKEVKIYVDGDDFKQYYVAVNEILPDVVEH